MKSVIRGIAPHVAVIDLTHDVPPHDVRAGSLALARCAQYVAPGVVLAVVDPGVGTARRAVAVQVAEGQGVFVGPDNGLLAAAVAMTGGAERAVELSNPAFHLPAPGATFAGRDVFGPAAAHLCAGVPLDELGEAVDPLGLQPGIMPLSRQEGRGIAAEVLWVDRYGNVQLNVDPEEVVALGDRLTVRAGAHTRTAAIRDAYAEVGPGEVGLVVDSYGLLSLAADRTSAAEMLSLGAGDAVTLDPADDEVTIADGGGGTPVRLGRAGGHA